MSNNVINVYKTCGQTPFDCIVELKKGRKDLGNLPMTYAGRLDPLAEGVLLILVGDEVNKKDEYLNLDKEYEVDILFGFATDTYDLMGKITDIGHHQEFSGCPTSVISKFTGLIKQQYPPYSSRPVNGKPLFMWAREGKLNEIEIPTHDVFVEKIEIIKEKEITGKALYEKIKNDIGKVSGDFRQEEILKIWENELKDKHHNKYPIIRLRINCGSGAYMRSVAYEIGQVLGIPTLALHIVRTKIGDYTIQK